MNRFDVVEKITLKDLFHAAAFAGEAQRCLGRWGLAPNLPQVYRFNWGRNALFALFNQLPCKTIHLPAFTCSVLTDAALAAGKKIVLLESDPQTYNLDLAKLPKRSPECLVAVHTFGNPVNVKKIRRRYPQTFIIEDCAHGLFSKIENRGVGKEGDAVLFSLYKQVPNLNGALLYTKRPLVLGQKQESISSFWPRILFKTAGWHQIIVNLLRKRYLDTLEYRPLSDAYKPHRLTEALFCQGLERLAKHVVTRRRVAHWFTQALTDNPFFLVHSPPKNGQSSWYQYVVRVKPKFIKYRDELTRRLRQQGIFVDRLWYSAPITESKFRKFRLRCPQALQLAHSVISLPIRDDYREQEVQSLVQAATQVMKKLIA